MYDYETVKSWAEEVIAEKGSDYIYESPGTGSTCVYATKDDEGNFSPSCLIGIMLHRQGLLDLAKVYDRKYHYNGQRIAALLDEYNYTNNTAPTCDPRLFTRKAKTFMSWLQSGQDSSKTWGSALLSAVEWCSEYDEDGHRTD